MKKLLLPLLILTAGPVLSCSNLMLNQNHHVAVARTMDFPINTGANIGFGQPQQQNQSDLNADKGKFQSQAAKWISTHYYIGMTWRDSAIVVDGVNDSGVYAAYLYLSDFTQYPSYDSNNPKKGLGLFDIVNYVLATANSTEDAIAKLKNLQLVENAAPSYIEGKSNVYMNVPLHVVIRDKRGDSAVIEWRHGKTKIYNHAGNVLTNAPTYSWQVNHAKQFDNVANTNTNAKFKGAYASGSGFIGMPGDWTSPSRFTRAVQIIKHLPKVDSIQQVMRQALTVLESVQVPLGTNPNPTLWKTVHNLENPSFYFYPMVTYSKESPYATKAQATFTTPEFNRAWKKYSISNYKNNPDLAKTAIPAISKPATIKIDKVIDLVSLATPGPGKHTSTLVSLLTANKKNTG